MTVDECRGQLKRLNVLRNPPGDVAEYVELLAGATYRELAAGVSLALKNRTFFPVPAELFSDCEQARPRETWRSDVPQPEDGDSFTHHIPNPFGGKGITVTVSKHVESLCSHCDDTGWLTLWCGAGEKAEHISSHCGRRGEHGAHTWAKHCQCWESNPTVLSKRQRQADSAIARTARGNRE